MDEQAAWALRRKKFVGTNVAPASYVCVVKLEEAIQQRVFQSPQQKAILNVLFTAAWITEVSEQTFKGFGLTAQQYNVLRILRGRHPQPLWRRRGKSRDD